MAASKTAVTVAKITSAGVVLAAMIAAAASIYSSRQKPKDVSPIVIVPPSHDLKAVPKLQDETPSTDIETLRDVSMWDLRGWKPVDSNDRNIRQSPANYINYLHVRKLKQADTYRAHYATNGSMIDMRCITHGAKIFQNSGASDHPAEGKTEYEIDVEVSTMPLKQEFLIVIEATYWNSFQKVDGEEASTYTDEDMQKMEELAIFVLMPEGKPFKNAQRWWRVSGSTNREEYHGDEQFYEDKDGKFLYWSIKEKLPNRHYQVSWTW